MNKRLHLSLIIPAYNEEGNLDFTIHNIVDIFNKNNVSYELIIVDNGSTDNSFSVIHQLKKEIPEVRSIKIYPNIGYGNGVIQGLKIAKGDILGFIPADGQTKPKDVLNIYLKVKESDVEICKGIRVVRNDNFTRKLISFIYNSAFKLMFYCPYRDINSPPKIFKRDFYETANLKSKDWFLDAEIMLKAYWGKYKAEEVPIVFLPRKNGWSKVHFITLLEFFKNMIYWFLVRLGAIL